MLLWCLLLILFAQKVYLDCGPEDPAICSGHGNCNEMTNLCECYIHYFGPYCNRWTCFNKNNTSPFVCNGHGTCSRYNYCDCNDNWHNSRKIIAGNEQGECDTWRCYSYDRNDFGKVCGGNGKCTSNDHCECIDGYVGGECESWSCYGFTRDRHKVCSGHGKCVKSDKCVCDFNYGGEKCSEMGCNGIASTNPGVCTGHGNCLKGGKNKNNKCNCTSAQYYGDACELWSCFGKVNNDYDICSGNGRCVEKDYCQCDDGYFGKECQFTRCFGKLQNSKDVCNRRGVCISGDNCECEDNYHGKNCGLWKCGSVWNTNNSVCSGAGICVEHDHCNCNQGLISFYDEYRDQILCINPLNVFSFYHFTFGDVKGIYLIFILIGIIFIFSSICIYVFYLEFFREKSYNMRSKLKRRKIKRNRELLLNNSKYDEFYQTYHPRYKSGSESDKISIDSSTDEEFNKKRRKTRGRSLKKRKRSKKNKINRHTISFSKHAKPRKDTKKEKEIRRRMSEIPKKKGKKYKYNNGIEEITY